MTVRTLHFVQNDQTRHELQYALDFYFGFNKPYLFLYHLSNMCRFTYHYAYIVTPLQEKFKLSSITLARTAWFHSCLCQMLAYNSPVMSRRCMQTSSRAGRSIISHSAQSPRINIYYSRSKLPSWFTPGCLLSLRWLKNSKPYRH